MESVMMTAKEASELIGCTSHNVVNHVKDGQIKGVQIGNRWYVNRKALYQMLGMVEADEVHQHV